MFAVFFACPRPAMPLLNNSVEQRQWLDGSIAPLVSLEQPLARLRQVSSLVGMHHT
jgi:hypothetical protein